MNTSPKITDVFSIGTKGEAYQSMLQEIADECCDPQNPGCVALQGPNNEFNDLYDEFLAGLADFVGEEQAKRTVIQLEGFSESSLEPSFANRTMTELLCDLHHKGDETCRPRQLQAVVSLYQDPGNRERFLSIFTSRCPEVRVYFVSMNDPAIGMIEKITRRDGNAETLFDTREEFNALGDELPWVIEGIAHEGEITVFGALPKDNKTWLMLSAAKARLTGENFVGYFNVPTLSDRVVYLIPEAPRRSFYHRLKLMRLDHYIGDRLLVRTLSKGPAPVLDDPAILKAAEGSDVFLDTAVRFSTGDENAASDVKILSQSLFGLLEAGARSIWCAHHAPKAFREASTMNLENMLRGSGDLGAMLSNAYGLRKLDEVTNTVHVECLAGRDLPELVKPFQLCGRPYLTEIGDFKMVKKPGECGTLADHVKKAGRPGDEAKEAKIQMVLTLKQEGKSLREIEDLTGVKKSTTERWLRDQERDSERPPF